MLDVVFLAMFLVIPVLAWSIYLVRVKRNYLLHKRVQVTLGLVLLAAVTLFELDMRLNGWTHRAVDSPYWGDGTWAGSAVMQVLAVHLAFAVTTALVWIAVIARALKRFPSPPVPGPHSAWHRPFGWVAAIDMALTSVTGWIFYWLAFAL